MFNLLESFLEAKGDKSAVTLYNYRLIIQKFLEWLQEEGIESVEEVKPIVCQKYQNFLASKNKPASVNTMINTLRSFFDWLSNLEYIVKNPFNAIGAKKVPHRESTFLSESEVEALIDACKNWREKAMIGLFLGCGLRRFELATLRLSQIDGRKITIIGKGDKEANLYMPDETFLWLNSYLLTRDYESEFVFASKNKEYKEPVSGESIRKLLISICERAGFSEERLSEVSPHKLRHTFCTMYERNYGIEATRVVARHSSVSTTQRYVHGDRDKVEGQMTGFSFSSKQEEKQEV